LCEELEAIADLISFVKKKFLDAVSWNKMAAHVEV
jgi:hypothetical protein